LASCTFLSYGTSQEFQRILVDLMTTGSPLHAKVGLKHGRRRSHWHGVIERPQIHTIQFSSELADINCGLLRLQRIRPSVTI
jgi:hypothetical protein